MKRAPDIYCKLMCNKIGMYIQQVHKKDLLRMNVEFTIDEFGKVWLIFAKNIWLREKSDQTANFDLMLS